jgi:hypothetical protein
MNESSAHNQQAQNHVKPVVSFPPMFDHENLDALVATTGGD